MSEYPALKNTFETNWLATWLNSDNQKPIDVNSWDELSLKERINVIAHSINEFLGEIPLEKKIDQLDELLTKHQPWDKGNMLYWPIFSWIELFGFEAAEPALHFLAKHTHLFTAEFAIRPIIEVNETLVFDFLGNNLNHPDEHVRRWISEGTRPRLPWGKQLKALKTNSERGLKLINNLINDHSAYVRKSVANHLNDVYRENKTLALKYAKLWWQQNTTHSQWIVKHGLRSAIKDGYTPALELLGYNTLTFKDITLTVLEKVIPFNGAVQFSINAELNKPSNLIMDYAIDFVRANGKTGQKVFKLKTQQDIKTIALEKTHSFKPISTRKYYPGTHTITILANGKAVASETFELLKP